VCWAPLYHDMGLIGHVLQSLYIGAPCFLMSPVAFLQKPFRWLQAISRYRAHTSGAPNFAYDLCARKVTPEQCAALDLSCWKVAFNGAEPIRPETLERFTAAFETCGFRREAFYPGYGLAEATLLISGGVLSTPPVVRTFHKMALAQNRVIAVPADHTHGQALVSCGQSLSEQKIVIADPQSLSTCSNESIGEIWVAGASVAQGYWNHPDETKKTFQARLTDTGEGPFLRTGDLGFLRDGELFVTGRLKDLIIVRGRNHYPQDIEQTVEQSHHGLRHAACAAFSVERAGEEQVVLVQELERHYVQTDTREIIDAIRRSVVENHELQVYAVILIRV